MPEESKFFNEDGELNKKVHAGSFKVASVTENKNGSLSYEFEYDEDFALYYKMKTGKKRITQKGISKFILEILEERNKTSQEKGYALRKEKEEPRRKFYKVYK